MNIHTLLSIPRSFWFCLMHLPFRQAIRIPILIGYNVKVLISGGVSITDKRVKFGIIRLGLNKGSLGVQTYAKSFLIIPRGSMVIFRGDATISKGFTIRLGEKARLEIGNKFFSNQNFQCFCSTKVTIGDEVLVGWDVHVRDSDGHKILSKTKGQILNANSMVSIESKVWIGANVTVLKGVKILNDTVVAMKSMVTYSQGESNCIIAGIPAKIVKKDIIWKK